MFTIFIIPISSQPISKATSPAFLKLLKHLIMKAIFSTLSIAALCALVSAAPTRIAKRNANGPLVTQIAASAFHIIDENNPNTDVNGNFQTNTAVISRSDTTLDIDTLVNFVIPPLSEIPGATASSTCDFVVYNAFEITGSQTLQLFTTVTEADLAGPLTFNTAPSSNQYEGMYFVNGASAANPGISVAIDVNSFPCQFGSTMQFIMRPQNDNDFITWEQGGSGAIQVGAFIEIRN
jgi:hypothetical protein